CDRQKSSSSSISSESASALAVVMTTMRACSPPAALKNSSSTSSEMSPPPQITSVPRDSDMRNATVDPSPSISPGAQKMSPARTGMAQTKRLNNRRDFLIDPVNPLTGEPP